MAYIIQRLKEPSTYAGIATLLVALGLSLPSGIVEAVTHVGLGVAGLLSIFLPENRR